MEVKVIASSQAKLARTDLPCRELGFCNSKTGVFSSQRRICFRSSLRWENAVVRSNLKAIRSEVIAEEKVSGSPSASSTRSEPTDDVRLFVGLPLDAVSDSNTLNHAKAISAGLKALKLLGVEGVELPVWWGIVEKEAMGEYDWSSYLALAEMVQKVGLKLHISLCFHASKVPKIPLPNWVSQIGKMEPHIFFADCSGQHYEDCLSFAVDELPVLQGRTPLQVYRDFCESFKKSFSPFMGSTITGISMGLGPDGELRYPSDRYALKSTDKPGLGEFQCYDKHMLMLLKQHAEEIQNPNWGLSGPHDTPSYDQSPTSNNFFKDHGGSWETPYGNFFLSWYSNQLLLHGERLLSLASTTFNDSPIRISGKIPLVHSWYKTRSHPSELTAGFYNTEPRDGYEAVAELFSRNSCKIILPGMDLSDGNQPNGSSPELLLAQIKRACRKHGVEVSGQNLVVSSGGFEQIKKNLGDENVVIDLFTYQRMGAQFFSPDHFPSFTGFVRSLNQPELHSDDLPMGEEADTGSLNLNAEPGRNTSFQVA